MSPGEIFAPATALTVCAVALLKEDGSALLQLRDDKPGLRAAGQWVFPGGHVEEGESVDAGARREFLEETTYQCADLQWLASVNDVFYPSWPSYPLHVFVARYDGIQPFRCLEGQDLRFFARADADHLPMPRYQLLLWDLAITHLNPE